MNYLRGKGHLRLFVVMWVQSEVCVCIYVCVGVSLCVWLATHQEHRVVLVL